MPRGTLGRRGFLQLAGGAALASICPLPAALAALPATPARKSTVARGPLYWSWWGWEPLDHYRRLGGNAGAVDGSAPWLNEWFDRLHSEEFVRTMTGLGVNLAITHFFKGFGLKHEREAQQRTAELVRCAHRHGLRVLGYCQSRSLYYETFLAEEPTAESWIQRDAQGSLRTWGSAYYRWAPCIRSKEFRAYMKRAIRVGLEEIGLDGLHFDNDYSQPCYCERCQQAFRGWLTENYAQPRDRFGLADFNNVRQPPTLSPTPGRIQDPLAQAWVRFRCEGLADYHHELAEHARALRPEVILLGNPAYPRHLDGPYRISVWGPWVGRQLDLLFAENGNFPCIADGVVVSQIRAYKHAAAAGYRVVSTTWRRGRDVGLGLPDKPELVQLQVAEAAAYNGIPGTNWAPRPTGEGAGMRIDDSVLRGALARYLEFARRNEKLMAGARPVRDVAVLHAFPSLALNWQDSGAHLLGAEEVLIRGGFSWEVVFDDDLARLEGFAALVLAGQSYLDQATCDAVRRFVGQGGGLVLAGPAGTCDEGGRVRPAGGLEDLAGPRVAAVDPKTVHSKVAASYETSVALPKRWQDVAAAVEQAAAGRLSVRLLGSTTVALSAYELADGRLAVHLVNYAAGEPVKSLKLALGPRWQSARRAEFLTPESPDQPLAIAAGKIELPPFPVYAVALLDK